MRINDLKIAICASDSNKSATVDGRFARCQVYAIFENGEISFVPNTAKSEMSGAGAKAGKQLASLGVDVVLVPEIGPKAYDALEAFEIKSYRYESTNLTIEEAITALQNDELTLVQGFTHKGKH